MLQGVGLFIFIIATLTLGIGCTFFPNQVIHFVFGRSSESQRETDRKAIPGFRSDTDEFFEFLKLAAEDPDLISYQFPEYSHKIRGIGMVFLLILFISLCGLLIGVISI